MAKQLTDLQAAKFNWAPPSTLTRTEKATYPWDEWLDGHVWKLTQGKDFFPHPLMMERIIRTRATGRGAKVRLRHEPFPARKGFEPDPNNPFGVIVLQRVDIPYPTNGDTPAPAPAAKKTAAKATAKKTVEKAAPAAKKTVAKKAPAAKKTAAKKAPAKKTVTKAAVKPEASANGQAPTKTPAKRAPRKSTAKA